MFDTKLIHEWALESGEIAKRLFNHVSARRKADSSPVTEADEQIEQLLVERIRADFPDHGILGEESARQDLEREFVWALDPIDGTDSFVTGLPMWAISIGLLRHGQPYAGAIYLPLLNDFYAATPDGAWLNGEPLSRLVAQPPARNGWIAVPSNVHRRFRIDYPGKTRSLGSIAAALCYVARGSAEGMLLTSAALWDMAAGLALLRAVGGDAWRFGSDTPIDTASLLRGEHLRGPVVIGEATRAAAIRDFTQMKG